MLDRYFWGEVSRISPEAPVPIVNVKKNSSVLGGAANVAANISGLNADPILVGICGFDNAADELKELLNKSKITNYIFPIKDRKTTVKTRIIAHSQHVARLDQESTDKISIKESDEIYQKIQELLDEVPVVLISDYAKGIFNRNLLERLITQAITHNKQVLVDPKGKDFSKYKNSTILTPNLRETVEASGIEENDSNFVSKAGKKIFKDVNTEALLITKGEQGMTLIEKNGKEYEFAALARKVYDVTGAGDTVIAVFATALGAGASFMEAAEIANVAAGLVVAEVGTTAITLDDLLETTETINDFNLG